MPPGFPLFGPPIQGSQNPPAAPSPAAIGPGRSLQRGMGPTASDGPYRARQDERICGGGFEEKSQPDGIYAERALRWVRGFEHFRRSPSPRPSSVWRTKTPIKFGQKQTNDIECLCPDLFIDVAKFRDPGSCISLRPHAHAVSITSGSPHPEPSCSRYTRCEVSRGFSSEANDSV